MNGIFQLWPYSDRDFPVIVVTVSLSVAVVYLIIYVYIRRNDEAFYPGMLPIVSILNAFIVGLGVACCLFTLIVFISKVGVYTSFISSLFSGRTQQASEVIDVVVLQLVSILVTFSALWFSFPYRTQTRERLRNLYRLVCQLSYLDHISIVRNWEPFLTGAEQYPELNGLPPRYEKQIQDYRTLSQYGVYLVVLANLWALVLMGVEATRITFMTAVFFFIIDDWAIIADYSRALKGRVFGSHKFRITTTNIALTAALGLTIYQEYNWFGMIVCAIPLAVFFMWRYRLAKIAQEKQTLYTEHLDIIRRMRREDELYQLLDATDDDEKKEETRREIEVQRDELEELMAKRWEDWEK